MHRHMGVSAGLLGLLLFVCSNGFSAGEGDIDAAIERGLAWIMANPATCEDGGFLDLVDEGLFYLSIRRMSAGPGSDSRYERAFDDCIARLVASPGFERRLNQPNKTLIEHYHLLLATYLIEAVQGPMAGRDPVIEEAQRTLVNNRFENPTFRLTVAMLLRHLGEAPQVSMNDLLGASLINHSAQVDRPLFPGQPPPGSLYQHPLAYYALVHEVAALTEFGRLPVSDWLMVRRDSIGRILQEGSRRFMVSAHIDLLAEILLCNHMLDLPLSGDLRAAAAFLVASQHADGTWGEQETPRLNRRRHAVQTVTAALMASKPSLQAQ